MQTEDSYLCRIDKNHTNLLILKSDLGFYCLEMLKMMPLIKFSRSKRLNLTKKSRN